MLKFKCEVRFDLQRWLWVDLAIIRVPYLNYIYLRLPKMLFRGFSFQHKIIISYKKNRFRLLWIILATEYWPWQKQISSFRTVPSILTNRPQVSASVPKSLWVTQIRIYLETSDSCCSPSLCALPRWSSNRFWGDSEDPDSENGLEYFTGWRCFVWTAIICIHATKSQRAKILHFDTPRDIVYMFIDS